MRWPSALSCSDKYLAFDASSFIDNRAANGIPPLAILGMCGRGRPQKASEKDARAAL